MTSDPGRRIAFMRGALVVYRIGSFLPLPGGDLSVWARQDGVIAGIAPGGSAAAHLDRVWSRIAVVGAAYLAVFFLIPELVISATRVPYYLHVASAMIVMCTILDIAAQIGNEAPRTFGGNCP